MTARVIFLLIILIIFSLKRFSEKKKERLKITMC